jgi:8-oxo-dGTP pyrophosphatase MutT (NUDIX family)
MIDDLVPVLTRTLAERQRTTLTAPDKTAAAVLVPLVSVDGEPHLLFTRRAASLPHHQGQVAFPGGSYHPGVDSDLAATALRETAEEINLEPASVRLLGPLDDIETVASRFVITPFVGVVPHPYPWRPAPGEVDAIFLVSLRVLRQPEVVRHEIWDFDGRQIPIDSYAVAGHVIWGATFRITQNLLGLLGELG